MVDSYQKVALKVFKWTNGYMDIYILNGYIGRQLWPGHIDIYRSYQMDMDGNIGHINK